MHVLAIYKQHVLIGFFIIASVLFLMQLHKKQNTFINQEPKPEKNNALVLSADTTQFVPTYPSQVLSLTNWKLTLPIGSSSRPMEIFQPRLSKYTIDPWFVVAANGTGVRFRAPVDAVTTSGSKYPRSELREMKNNGETNASWSSISGIHAMSIVEAITSVPIKKKHVVAGQIHGANDDIIVIRLEYPNLYVNVNGKNVYTLDPHYTLGKLFTIKFAVHDGKTDVYYNGSANPLYTLVKNYSGAYFKAGAYTQSNCSREGSAAFCNENNYGEVIVYQAVVTHQ